MPSAIPPPGSGNTLSEQAVICERVRALHSWWLDPGNAMAGFKGDLRIKTGLRHEGLATRHHDGQNKKGEKPPSPLSPTPFTLRWHPHCRSLPATVADSALHPRRHPKHNATQRITAPASRAQGPQSSSQC
jgi:hypothetical protein